MYCHTSRHLMITSLFVKHLEVTAVGTRRWLKVHDLTLRSFKKPSPVYCILGRNHLPCWDL